MSTAEWMTKFGDLDLTASSRERAVPNSPNADLKRVTMTLGEAYPATVLSAKVVRSRREDVQLQVTFSLHSDTHEQEPIGKDTEWLTLPFQANDAKLAADVVRKITLRRRDDLVRILSAVEPGDFQLYARREGTGRAAKYFAHDGRELERAALNAREKAINGRVLEWAEGLHDQVDAYVDRIKGARVYLAKVENPKNTAYPYLNIFSTEPAKLPIHGRPDHSRGHDVDIDF